MYNSNIIMQTIIIITKREELISQLTNDFEYMDIRFGKLVWKMANGPTVIMYSVCMYISYVYNYVFNLYICMYV